LVYGESLIGVRKPWRTVGHVTTTKWLEPCISTAGRAS
jgi:hypothetical protein